jgi:hypothetical protein
MCDSFEQMKEKKSQNQTVYARGGRLNNWRIKRKNKCKQDPDKRGGQPVKSPIREYHYQELHHEHRAYFSIHPF